MMARTKRLTPEEERERQRRIDDYAGQYAGIRVAELATRLVDLEMQCEADALRDIRRKGR
jgi:hypothetical protein